MTSSQIQAAINLKQTFTKEPYESPTYTPSQVEHIYRLERLARMEQQNELVKFRLIRIDGGTLTLRHWDHKKAYDSLDNVLKGGLINWRLASYGICKDGLILKFLPIHKPELMAEAQEYLDQLDTDVIPGVLNQHNRPAHLIGGRRLQLEEECQNKLYQKFATTIVADGKFQARFDIDPNSCDMFACGRTATALYSIRRSFSSNEFRKTSKVTYHRRSSRALIINYK